MPTVARHPQKSPRYGRGCECSRCFVLHTSGESELLQVEQPVNEKISSRQMNIFMGEPQT
jgi:hypothetical protein